ncbi:MAG TPA: hypothetical protein VFT72_16485 [Opitutaceae bacterium]|nr:hypothetical protein [Opitutaceae bacterium]
MRILKVLLIAVFVALALSTGLVAAAVAAIVAAVYFAFRALLPRASAAAGMRRDIGQPGTPRGATRAGIFGEHPAGTGWSSARQSSPKSKRASSDTDVIDITATEVRDR